MINDIQQIFKDNNNKWMTDREVFNILNERGFNWGPNKKGTVGHKNMVARELSDRHRDKFDIDKSVRPQKYRLKDFNDKKVNNMYLDDEIRNQYIDRNIESNEDDNKTSQFTLDIENISFQEYNIPTKIKYRKKESIRDDKVRKIDYEKRGKRNKIKGNIGEEAVILLEKNKLISLGRKDLIEDVEWASKEKGDGLGYDIVSWDVNNREMKKIYIEVKTTEGDIKTPFDVSDTEVRVSKELSENYCIYRIFGIEKVTRKINYYIIKGDIQNNFELVPTSYKAYIKTN